MVEAYPLYWPDGYPRAERKKKSRFKTTLGQARDFVKAEIKRMDGQAPVISTNIPLKNDGDLRADWTRYRIDDHGVAVYFTRNGSQVCLCCDQYERVWENLYAIGRTIQAMRQIDRDGVSDFINRAFSGFTAIPERAGITKTCYETLGITSAATEWEIKLAWKKRSMDTHPDRGGSVDAFHQVQEAYKVAMKLLNKYYM